MLAGGVTVAALMDRFSRAAMVITTYLLAAAALSGSRMGVLLALIFASAAATSASPTFTETFPTELRSTGVGFSVAVGRAGAAISAIGIAAIAGSLGLAAAFAVFAGLWLLGVAAMVLWTLGGCPEGAGVPLERLESSFEKWSV